MAGKVFVTAFERKRLENLTEEERLLFNKIMQEKKESVPDLIIEENKEDFMILSPDRETAFARGMEMKEKMKLEKSREWDILHFRTFQRE